MGETFHGEVRKNDPVLASSERLEEKDPLHPPIGRTWRFLPDEKGPFEITARSECFDAYLVVRTAGGTTLAEDDDAVFPTNARVALELEPGSEYLVDVVALSEGHGPFELDVSTVFSPDEPEIDPDRLSWRAELVRRIKEIMRGDPLDAAARFARRAEELRLVGRFEESRALFERALALRFRDLGPDHPQTAASCSNLALLLRDLGQYEEARGLSEKALVTHEKVFGLEHPRTANSLDNLANVLRVQGLPDEARPLHERSLAIREKTLDPGDRLIAASLNNLGLLHQEIGELEEALRFHQRALEFRRSTLGDDHLHTIQSFNNIANLYADLGNYDEARRFYELALAGHEKSKGSEHPLTATSLSNLADLYADLGLFEDGAPLAERAVEIWEEAHGPHHPDVAYGLGSLASQRAGQGRIEEALRLHERALEVRSGVLGAEHPTTASSMLNLGVLLHGQGRLAEAQLHYERVLAIYEDALGSDHPDTALSLYNLATLLHDLGRLEEARSLLERSVAAWRTVLGREHPNTARSLERLAMVVADQGEPGKAFELALQGDLSRRRHLDRAMAGTSEAEAALYLAHQSSRPELLLSLIPPSTNPSAAYEAVLTWKSRVARLLSASRARFRGGLSPEETAILDELRATQALLSTLFLRSGSVDRSETLKALRTRRNKLEIAWRRAAALRISRESSAAVDIARTLAEISPRSAGLDFIVHRTYVPGRPGHWSSPRLSAWILRPEASAPLLVDLGPARAIEDATRSYLQIVAGGGEARARERAAGSLRELLWLPLARHLVGIETVFVSPDDFLGTLPLEVIELQDGAFLVEHHAFVYLHALSRLVEKEPGADRSFGSLLAVGSVDFATTSGVSAGPVEASAGDPWMPLAFTSEELDDIVELHRSSLPGAPQLQLRGMEATEERLKQELPRFDLVHLATHAFFQSDRLPGLRSLLRRSFEAGGLEAERLASDLPGFLSGLVCSGVDATTSSGNDLEAKSTADGVGGLGHEDDGYLTAEEVGWLDLTEVDLVVLSACETALGRPRAGDGMLGLRRAFHAAGARTVISSLWSVQDESTSRLMRFFYRNLWQRGMGRLEALRTAQLDMLRRERREPSTWGAFVLSGEWE